MKISCLACGAACAAAWGCALAQDPQVELYGGIDAGVVRFTGISADRPDDSPPSGRTTTVSGLSQAGASGSYLGLRGAERLGPGLRVAFRAETGLCNLGLSQPDAGGDPYCSGGGFMQRAAWVQLESGVGVLRLGRQVTMLAEHSGDADAFDNSYLGQVGNLSLLGNNLAGLDMQRASQAVSWFSPERAGLQVLAQYALHAGQVAQPPDPDDLHDPSALILGLRYRDARWLLGLDWSRWQHGIGSTEDLWDRSYRFAMVYAALDLGGPRVFAQAQEGRADGFSGRQSAISLGLSLPVGRGSWMVSVGRFGTSLAPQPTRLDTSWARQVAIGYSHALSPATRLYASAARIVNDAPGPGLSGTALAVGAAGELFHGVPGRGSSGIGVGLSHSF